MELFYEKRDGYAVLTGYSGEQEHIKIGGYHEGLPVMEIEAGVFENHQELLTVEIPMSLLRIGQDCFKWCSNLYCVCVAEEAGDHSVFPPALYYIGDRAFYTLVQAISRTVSALVAGDKHGPCNIDNHNDLS